MRIALKKNSLTKILLSFLFFLYLFQPPLFRITLVYILDMVFLIVILLNCGKNPKIRINSSIKKAFMGFLPFLLYFFVYMTIKLFTSDGIGMEDIYFENIKRVMLTVIHLVIGVSFLLSIKKKNKYTINDIIDMLIMAAFWQLLFVGLSFAFPSVKTFFNNLIMTNSKSDAIVNALSSFGSYRGYGFADNLFDQFGYTYSLLTVLVLIEGIERKKTSLTILSFLMLIPSLLNTRTGILLSIVGIIVVLLMYLDRMKLKSLFKGLVIAGVIIITGYYVLGRLSDTTFSWVSNGMNEITSLIFENESTGTFYYLSQDIIMPSDILFGAGGAPSNFSLVGIDVGYIQSIWMYGLIGTVLLFAGYLFVFFQLYKSSNNRKGRCIAICFTLVFFWYTIKLFACYYPGSNFVLFGVPILLMVEQQKYNFQVNRLAKDKKY